jgi:hypothetical protein
VTISASPIATASFSSAGSVTTGTATFSGGHQATANNTLIAVIASANGAGSADTSWNQDQYASSWSSIDIYSKIAVGGETGFTASEGTAGGLCIFLMEFAGISAPPLLAGAGPNIVSDSRPKVNQTGGLATATSQATVPTPAINTTVADVLIIAGASSNQQDFVATGAWSSGFTELFAGFGGTGGELAALCVGMLITTATGTYSTAATMAAACTNNCALITAYTGASAAPPTVVLGGPSVVNLGRTATFAATAVATNGFTISTYAWSITARPTGSTATVAFPTAASTTFVPDLPGTYTLQCVVTDNAGEATTKTITFTGKPNIWVNKSGTLTASEVIYGSVAKQVKTVPPAPTVIAHGGATSVSATWTPPKTTQPITGYVARLYTGSTPTGTPVTQTLTGTSYTFTGLTNGTTYTVTVSATNAMGTGPASAPVTATPSALTGTPTYYASTALINQPLQANPVLDANSADIVANLASGPTADIYTYGMPVWVTNETGGVSTTVTCTYNHLANPIYIPTGATPASGTDGDLIIIDTVTGYEHDLFQAVNNAGTWSATTGITLPYNTSTPWLDYQGNQNGATGSGLSELYGLCLISDLNAGVIPHALRFSSAFTTHGFKGQAVSTDGQTVGGGVIEEGARVQLDPAINLSAIPGITAFEVMVGTALQVYGAICGDTGGGSMAITFETPHSGTAPYSTLGATTDYFGMNNIPWSSLRVLAT